MFPSHGFEASGSERISLTLLQASVRQVWHNVNSTNSIFYLVDATNQHYEVRISTGSYTLKAELALAIAAAIEQTLLAAALPNVTGVAVSHNPRSRGYTIEFNGGGPYPRIRCFHTKTVAPYNGTTVDGMYQQTHEILGARPVRDELDAADPRFDSLYQLGARPSLNISRHPASLSSLSAIYLRCNLQSTHFQSTLLDERMRDSDVLIESHIMARLPVLDGLVEDAVPDLHYVDPGNDQFQLWLSQAHVGYLEFEFTDAQGRSLGVHGPNPLRDGQMKFELVVRFDLHS